MLKIQPSTSPAVRKQTDIRIEEVSFAYEDFIYRTPIKFGGTALDGTKYKDW